MAEQQQTQGGMIAQARAAAPQAVTTPTPAPQPTTQAPAPQQGFGGAQSQNGFAAPQPAPVAEPVQQPVEPVVTDNDRTRQQFEKLTDTNQRLADTNELLRQELLNLQKTRQQSNQQFAPIQQPTQPTVPQQQSAMPKLEDYIEVDQQTGERFVNQAKFNSAMAEIYQKATRAEEVVKNYVQTAEQREIARQETEAFQAYPQLNPRGGGFDQYLSQQTRAILYDSMMNPQDYPSGRPLSFKDAADFVQKGSISRQAPQVQAIPTPTVNEANQVQKEQAAVSVPSVPAQAQENVDSEKEYRRLVQGTRLGSDEAIAVRLLNAPHRIDEVGISERN